MWGHSKDRLAARLLVSQATQRKPRCAQTTYRRVMSGTSSDASTRSASSAMSTYRTDHPHDCHIAVYASIICGTRIWTPSIPVAEFPVVGENVHTNVSYRTRSNMNRICFCHGRDERKCFLDMFAASICNPPLYSWGVVRNYNGTVASKVSLTNSPLTLS